VVIPTLKKRAKQRPSPAERRLGYVVAVIAQAAMLYVANRLLEWEWPSFLTDDFEVVLPWLAASLIVGIILNAVYLAFDPLWFRSLGQLVENLFSLIVTARFLQVLPFDFSEWNTDWSWLVRMILWIAIVGVAVGSVVELSRLARHLAGADVDR
jgi:hypothetical protein